MSLDPISIFTIRHDLYLTLQKYQHSDMKILKGTQRRKTSVMLGYHEPVPTAIRTSN